jgi:hypothetical protein
MLIFTAKSKIWAKMALTFGVFSLKYTLRRIYGGRHGKAAPGG